MWFTMTILRPNFFLVEFSACNLRDDDLFIYSRIFYLVASLAKNNLSANKILIARIKIY